MDGWFGERCEQLKCDARCLEHGKCLNGSCLCNDGWMGKYCTLGNLQINKLEKSFKSTLITKNTYRWLS